jgi:CheY-like chemotaxis protein
VTVLNVLLVDDDPESLDLLKQSLPDSVEDATIRWEPCGSFEKAFETIADRRFDIVVADIYRDRKGQAKEPVNGDPQGGGILAQIRKLRFCPVLLFTSGVFPPEYQEGPFVKLADKSAGDQEIIVKLSELIRTGVPELAHLLHDELDRAAGSYLWEFLEENWSDLEAGGLTAPAVLDHLVHRRASIQLGRMEEGEAGLAERPSIEGAEFYVSPPITSEVRLGQILKREDEYRVVLTPHCYLAVQPGQEVPRADFILTVVTVPATGLFARFPLEGGTMEKRLRNLSRRLQSPSRFGQPEGRYWFLPSFLGMPDLYADLFQLQSLSTSTVLREWKPMAVLDVPFAEALQSCFVRFYSAVGLPMLDAERFMHMAETADEPPLPQQP